VNRDRFLAVAAVLACLLGAGTAHADHSVLEYASGGTTGGNGATHVFDYRPTRDGSRVFLQTTEALTADDTDTQQDAYEHVVGGGTSLVSTGPINGNGAFAADISAFTPDGSHVLFRTREPLVAADTDTEDDVYERAAGVTTLVSTSATANPSCFGAAPASAFAISDDGTRAFFQTNDRLVAEDIDCGGDLYERSGGTTTLVSKGSATQPAGNFDPAVYAGTSSNGTVAYFSTVFALEPSDTDTSVDVYKRAGGTTTLESVGPNGGNGAFGATGRFVSADGATMYFTTAESLVSEDVDTEMDIYVRAGGTTSLVSGGGGAFAPQFLRATPDGAHAVFYTSEQLVASDTDTRTDLYEYSADGVQLVSTGPAGGNGAFDPGTQVEISDDGAHILFMTSEKLVSADTDTQFDLYDRFGGTTTLVSPGTGNFGSQIGDITPDASRIFFSTNEKLVGADTDSLFDVYERAGNEVTLISPTPLGGSTSFAPSVGSNNGVSQDGSRVFLATTESYAAADTDNVSDVYVASRAGTPPAAGYPRPKSASPIKVSLVPGYQPCAVPNRTHGPPLAFGSCDPPAQASGSLTVGTPDANGQAAGATGSVRFAVLVGDPATMGDEADVEVTFSLTDVRWRSTLADYTGELQSTATVRITDRRNGTGVDAATVQDLPFPVTVPCAATAGAAGATCALTTTFDAVLPGAIAEGRRSIWEFDRVRVMDGGTDGEAATAPNDLFATQGLFVP
jgi:hypothetical protein